MNVAETVNQVESAGATFRLYGEKVRVWYPREERRQELNRQIEFLRTCREEVAGFLRCRAAIPLMPPGVCLVAWNLKLPPVAIDVCSVVTDPALFARTTLGQLGRALARPHKWVGWSVPQLLDRLAQVGVLVTLAAKE